MIMNMIRVVGYRGNAEAKRSDPVLHAPGRHHRTTCCVVSAECSTINVPAVWLDTASSQERPATVPINMAFGGLTKQCGICQTWHETSHTRK